MNPTLILALAHASADVFWLLASDSSMQKAGSSWQTFTEQGKGKGLDLGLYICQTLTHNTREKWG